MKPQKNLLHVKIPNYNVKQGRLEQRNQDEGLRTHTESKNWVGYQMMSQAPSGDVHQDLYIRKWGEPKNSPKYSGSYLISLQEARSSMSLTKEFYLSLGICKNWCVTHGMADEIREAVQFT